MYYKEERRIRIQGHVHCAIGNPKKVWDIHAMGIFEDMCKKIHYTTYLGGTTDELTKE